MDKRLREMREYSGSIVKAEATETEKRAVDFANRLIVIGEILSDPFAGRGLSPRQSQIARLIARGKTYDEVAEELDIAYSTVKHTLSAATDKMGVENSRELTEIVFQQIEGVLAASRKTEDLTEKRKRVMNEISAALR